MSSDQECKGPTHQGPLENLPRAACWGLVTYALTSAIVFLGVILGHDYFRLPQHALDKETDSVRALANWDGEHYVTIAKEGYSYDPRRASNVAFFPAYPLLGRAVAFWTGIETHVALIVLANMCLAGAFMLLAAYVCVRDRGEFTRRGYYTLLAFGLFPTTFFSRMAYSESMFILCCVAAFYGMERGWPLPVLAILCGLTTATRPVGVALLLPFALHVWEGNQRPAQRFLRLAVYLPLASWGVTGYMLYQYFTFSDPFAFAKTQVNWNMRPAGTLLDKVEALCSFEPLWDIFDPASPCYWRKREPSDNPLFSLHAANPVYFSVFAVLAVFGSWRGWLNRREAVLCVALLLIPYLSRGDEMCMAGQARFASAVFPVYLVLGRILQRVHGPIAIGTLAVSAFLVGTYAALFASWHRFF